MMLCNSWPALVFSAGSEVLGIITLLLLHLVMYTLCSCPSALCSPALAAIASWLALRTAMDLLSSIMTCALSSALITSSRASISYFVTATASLAFAMLVSNPVLECSSSVFSRLPNPAGSRALRAGER